MSNVMSSESASLVLTSPLHSTICVFERWKLSQPNSRPTHLCSILGFDSNNSCVGRYIDESNWFPSTRKEVCFDTVNEELNNFIVSCDGELTRSYKTYVDSVNCQALRTSREPVGILQFLGTSALDWVPGTLLSAQCESQTEVNTFHACDCVSYVRRHKQNKYHLFPSSEFQQLLRYTQNCLQKTIYSSHKLDRHSTGTAANAVGSALGFGSKHHPSSKLGRDNCVKTSSPHRVKGLGRLLTLNCLGGDWPSLTFILTMLSSDCSLSVVSNKRILTVLSKLTFVRANWFHELFHNPGGGGRITRFWWRCLRFHNLLRDDFAGRICSIQSHTSQ